MKIERFLSHGDATTLSRLAEHLLRTHEVKLNFGDILLDLISNATLLPENSTRADCVALHAKVTYRAIGSEERRTMTIVCPESADDAMGYVSVLAPLAIALIGRPKHSVVDVSLPFNQIQFIEILDVQQASARIDKPAGASKATGSKQADLRP
jgi:regulator of nucleoside diphosphate kinase